VKDILVNLKFMDGEECRHFIYTDETDAKRFTQDQVAKFAPTLVSKGLVESKVVNRVDTLQGISGTKMREYLKSPSSQQSFTDSLPHILDSHQRARVWDVLQGENKPIPL